MNLRHLSDETLLERTEKLAQSEREILIEVLHHLREIDRRRLYSDQLCTSLFDYAVKKLHYSEDQAWRRIAAMRLLNELPEVAEKINSGSITLTNIGMAQTLFRKEKKAGIKQWSRTEKLDVLTRLQGQSRQGAEMVILEFSSSAHVLNSDKIKQVAGDKIEINFVAPQGLQVKIEKLRGLLAHKFPELTLADLFDDLCEIGLKKYDPCCSAPRATRVKVI